MADTRNLTMEDAMLAAFQPMRVVPTISTSTSSTTPKDLVPDALATADPTAFVRRVRFYNSDAAIIQAILYSVRGVAASGTVASGTQVAPGGTVEVLVTANMKLGIVAASGTPAYNVTVSDFTKAPQP